MKLVVSRLATRRLHDISDYIRKRNPAAARRVKQSIRDAFALLLTYPEAGRAVERGVHRFAVPRLPYLIHYSVDEAAGAVNIVHRSPCEGTRIVNDDLRRLIAVYDPSAARRAGSAAGWR